MISQCFRNFKWVICRNPLSEIHIRLIFLFIFHNRYCTGSYCPDIFRSPAGTVNRYKKTNRDIQTGRFIRIGRLRSGLKLIGRARYLLLSEILCSKRFFPVSEGIAVGKTPSKQELQKPPPPASSRSLSTGRNPRVSAPIISAISGTE